jgi:hypothetical protein
MLSELIDKQDINEYKEAMDQKLGDFRDEWRELKQLSLAGDNE